METICPHFECIDFQLAECEKYFACEGCDKYCSCNVCANQTTLIGNSIIYCDLIKLPIPCRFCETRNQQDFDSSIDCSECETIYNGK